MIEAEKRQLEAQKEMQQLKQAYYRLFNTDDGKRVLQDLGKFCGYNNTSVCEHAPDALQTMFTEGKRRVFLRIMSQIRKETNG